MMVFPAPGGYRASGVIFGVSEAIFVEVFVLGVKSGCAVDGLREKLYGVPACRIVVEKEFDVGISLGNGYGSGSESHGVEDKVIGLGIGVKGSVAEEIEHAFKNEEGPVVVSERGYLLFADTSFEVFVSDFEASVIIGEGEGKVILPGGVMGEVDLFKVCFSDVKGHGSCGEVFDQPGVVEFFDFA